MKVVVNSVQSIENDEQGFILVLALFMLVVLSLLGIFASKTTTVELQVAGNERAAQDIFYVSESGWMRAFQWIENWGTSSAPPLINGKDADPDHPLVADVGDQELGGKNYSYTIRRASSPTKVPGNSKMYLKFSYTVDSSASGKGNAARAIEVNVEKISK